jgi:hypothetical protein
MEWVVFTGIVLLYGLKAATVYFAVCGNPQPRGRASLPPRPATQLGRLPGETSLNDFSAEERARIIQHLQRTQRRKKCPVPEKVNWKEEGF